MSSQMLFSVVRRHWFLLKSSRISVDSAYGFILPLMRRLASTCMIQCLENGI